MASISDYSSVGSKYVKEVYAPNVVRLYPETNLLMKKIPFSSASKQGKKYVIPIELAPEQGATYLAPGATSRTLVGAVPMISADAEVQPSQIVVQRALDYEAIARTNGGSKAAFMSMLDATLRSVVSLATKRQELSMLLGGWKAGLGVVSSLAAVQGTGATATRALTLTAAEWAAGAWAAMDNALVTVLSPVGNVYLANPGGQRNSLTKPYKVSGINISTRTVTLMDVNSDGTLVNIAANDIIVPYGAQQFSGSWTVNEMTGLFNIASNSGTLFAIDSTTASLWQGNTFPTWGAPSVGKILKAVSQLVSLGLDENIAFLVSPAHFAALNTDQTALRVYDSSYGGGGTAKNGFKSLSYMSSEGVQVDIIAHRFVPDGYGVFVPFSRCMRTGSTELTFNGFGNSGDIFLHTSGAAEVELRGYLGQALFCNAPSRCGLVTGVVLP